MRFLLKEQNTGRQTIGLIAGAFKPFHAGHFAAVRKALGEADKVVIFASNKSRVRKNEFPILWKNMEKVWKKYIIPNLPDNVEVVFTPNPLTELYSYLEEAENNTNNHNTYYIYSSAEDLQKRFTDEKLQRLFPRLYNQAQIEPRPTGTRDIASGTQMRSYLQNKNLEKFVAGLPEFLQIYGREIYETLLGN